MIRVYERNGFAGSYNLILFGKKTSLKKETILPKLLPIFQLLFYEKERIGTLESPNNLRKTIRIMDRTII